MTLPDFIVIGAAKAGTTALYWYLAEHPQIFMSPLKETNYFAYGVDSSGDLLYGDPELHNFRIRTLEEYRALFEAAGDAIAVGEASPIYLECPQTPGRIEELLPEARIVCGLRNPVDRAYSDYQMYLRSRGIEFDPVTDLGPGAGWARPDSHWMRIGRYGEMLSRYLEVIPAQRLHVYLYEDMRADTGAVLSALYGFLGVDPGFVPDLETPHNVGGIPARMGVERILTSKRAKAVLEPMIPKSLANLARRLRTANLRRAPDLPPDMRREMTDYFRDDIERTERMLGLDLSHWLGSNASASGG